MMRCRTPIDGPSIDGRRIIKDRTVFSINNKDNNTVTLRPKSGKTRHLGLVLTSLLLHWKIKILTNHALFRKFGG